MQSPTVILTHTQIMHKLKRMAYQVYESNVNEKEVFIAGIQSNGIIIAKMLKEEVEKISPIKVHLCEVKIDKKKPTNLIETTIPLSELKNKSLVLVDDVLHSGTTLIYGVKHFLEVPLKQFKTAVLVDRNHKKYPVKADYKGISLSTSLSENISVTFEKNACKAVLD